MALYQRDQFYCAPGSGTSGKSSTLNRTYAIPQILDRGVLDRLAIEVTTAIASSTIRLGIYTENNGYPDQVFLDAGTVDSSTTGYKELTISKRVDALGMYWLSYTCQGGASAPLVRTHITPQIPDLPQGSSLTGVVNLTTMLRDADLYSGALGAFGTPTIDNGGQVRLFFRYSTLNLRPIVAVEEFDEAQPLIAILNPPSLGAFYFAEETDTAQTFIAQRRYTLVAVTESDTAQTLTPIKAKRVAIGTTTETDTAQTLTVGRGIAAYDLATATDLSDLSSFLTQYLTPTSNRLVLAFIKSRNLANGTPTTPTLTGCGLTWVQHATQDDVEGIRRLSLFRAMGSPTEGRVTIDFGGVTQAHCYWSIIELTTVDTGGTNGSAAIVQEVSTANDVDTSLSVPLAAFGNVNNATVGGFGLPYRAVVAGAGFTKVSEIGAPAVAMLVTEFKQANDTTVDIMFNSSADASGIALEIKKA